MHTLPYKFKMITFAFIEFSGGTDYALSETKINNLLHIICVSV